MKGGQGYGSRSEKEGSSISHGGEGKVWEEGGAGLFKKYAKKEKRPKKSIASKIGKRNFYVSRKKSTDKKGSTRWQGGRGVNPGSKIFILTKEGKKGGGHTKEYFRKQKRGA